MEKYNGVLKMINPNGRTYIQIGRKGWIFGIKKRNRFCIELNTPCEKFSMRFFK